MTPAEIIYHRRVRLLSLADELGNVSAACRQMGISRTRYYEWRRRRRAVRARGVDAQGPSDTPAAQRDADPCRRGLLTLTVIEPDDRVPPVRRPARRTRLQSCPRRRCRSSSSTTAWDGEPNGSLERRRSPQRPAGWPPTPPATTEPFGFCHYSPAPGHLVAGRQLLHRQPQRCRQGVPADRHRRRHPLGDHADRHRHPPPPATRSASSTT